VAEGLKLILAEGEAEAEGLGVGLELAEGDGEIEDETLVEGLTEAEGDLLSSNPSSSSAWVQLSESTFFLISKFAPNLKAPGIPLSS